MPRIVREADATWEGTAARGSGTITAASSAAFTALPVTIASRIADPEGKTSPEELLAAAHAGCFITSSAVSWRARAAPPARLVVHCTITMDEVDGQGHRVVASAIDAQAWGPGADEALLARALEAADKGYPLSALLRPSADVSVEARLEGERRMATERTAHGTRNGSLPRAGARSTLWVAAPSARSTSRGPPARRSRRVDEPRGADSGRSCGVLLGMALSGGLAKAGTPPERLSTRPR